MQKSILKFEEDQNETSECKSIKIEWSDVKRYLLKWIPFIVRCLVEILINWLI